MSQQIQLRRGTASAWTTANTVLAQGEIGLETDTSRFKIGDGTTAWASLGYQDSAFPTLPISKGGTGQTTKTAAFDALSPNTTAGDLAYHNGTNNVRLAPNATATKKFLSETSSVPSWGVLAAADVPTLNQNTTGTAANVTGTVAIANGGTGQTAKTAAFDALSPMTTSGDIIYGGTSGTGTRLPKGSDTQVLTLTSGLPSWVTPVAFVAPRSYVRLSGGSGHGTSSTAGVRRFTTAVQNVGSAITYASSTTLGDTFTIAQDGLYSISYSDAKIAASTTFGLSLNASSADQNNSIGAITTGIALVSTAGGTYVGNVAWTGFLASGDVIRAHDDGGADTTDAKIVKFEIAQVSK